MNERPLIEPGAAKIISLADETKFAANGIVSRTLLRTENSRTVLFGFAEGQELTEHTSTQHALIQVLTGRCEFSLDGRRQDLKAGDFLYMPPNLPHAVRATEQFSMLLTLSKPAVTEKAGFFQAKPKSNPDPKKAAAVEPGKVFDGRGVPCSIKHGRIIQKWLRLAVGDYFVLLNDHDPERMREKFAVEWPGAFAWEHLQRGPVDFQVKITKLAPVTAPVETEPACSCEH